MAPMTKYSSIDDVIDDVDLENDPYDNESDVTAYSEGLLDQKRAISPPRKSTSLSRRSSKLNIFLTWFRWGTVVLLQTVILFVLLWRKDPSEYLDSDTIEEAIRLGEKMTETGGDINGLYKPTTHKYTLLTPDMDKYTPNMTSNDNRMEIRRNWDLLLPKGSGTVLIPDWKSHPLLGEPVNDDPIRSGSIYEASWTHAMHCLYYAMDSYHQLAVSNGTMFGFDGERNDYHASHCFEYLRNQILCMADMTLEGSVSAIDNTGKGQAHVCRDRSEAIEWIEARRVDDIQSIVGP